MSLDIIRTGLNVSNRYPPVHIGRKKRVVHRHAPQQPDRHRQRPSPDQTNPLIEDGLGFTQSLEEGPHKALAAVTKQAISRGSSANFRD